jgi:hypothetical protein
MTTKNAEKDSDYDLKIDTQVEKFLEMKQKLTYFLITASVAVIVFLANFTFERGSEIKNIILLVIISSIAGLLTSGFSLLNLHLEHKSYRLHIKYRYQKIFWESLGEKKKKQWDRINTWAAHFFKSALFFLFIEITFAVIFFITFFLNNNGASRP